MKKIPKKIIVGAILAMPVFTMIIFGLWFYFAPVPQAVKEKYKGEFQRCAYSFGIGYFTPIVGPDAFHRLYNNEGEVICNSGGFWGKQPEGPCAQKICFSIHDNK